MNATPTQLVFHHNAFLPVTFTADCKATGPTLPKGSSALLIDQNNAGENKKHKPHACYDSPQSNTWKGPFNITKVNDNGAVKLCQLLAHGATLQILNIWNIRPCNTLISYPNAIHSSFRIQNHIRFNPHTNKQCMGIAQLSLLFTVVLTTA